MTSPTLRSVRRPQPAPAAPVPTYRVCDRPEDADPASAIGRAVRDERDAQRDAIAVGERVGHVLDLHHRAERTIAQTGEILLRAVDRPDLLEGIDWPSAGRAELQARLLAPAVDLANRRLTLARETAHATTEIKVQAWSRYQDRRRRWDNPNSRMTDAEARDLERELQELAGRP